MDLSKAQIGDRVRSVLKGWGTITDKTYNNSIYVNFDEITDRKFKYDKIGKKDPIDKHPEIVEFVKPTIEIEECEYYLTADGDIILCNSLNNSSNLKGLAKKRGREFKNIKQAQVADEILTPIQRLLRFAMMYDPEFYEEDFYQNNLQENATIVWDEVDQEYLVIPYCRAGMTTIPMTEKTAIELVDELNAGRIKL